MQPMGLGRAGHDQKASVFQKQFDFLFGFFVFEREFPFRPKADGGDSPVFFQVFFPITVPRHSFLTGMVQIEQARVKGLSALFFDALFQFQQFLGPRKGVFGCLGIGVCIFLVTVPGHFSFGNNFFTENIGLVIFPFDVVQQGFVEEVSLFLTEDSTEVVDNSVFWKPVFGFV